MTRPTADEIRAEPAGRRLDMWVSECVLKWKKTEWRGCVVFQTPEYDEQLKYTDQSSKGLYLAHGECNTFMLLPFFSTDPAACAKLRRQVIADKRWQRVVVSYFCDCVVIEPVPDPDVEPNQWIEHKEDGTDPIAAECVAWCKVALLSVLGDRT